MKIRKTLLTLVCLISLSAPALAQTIATWNNFGGDGEWNNPLNWDTGDVPGVGTNATIGTGYIVNYSTPMVSPSFSLLGCASVLNVNAGGFVVDGAGDGAIGFTGSGAKLFINSGGVVSLPSGGLSLSNAAGLSVASGASLTVGGNFLLGRNGTGNTGFATNNGGTITATATSVNPNNASSTSLLVINGGTNDLGNVIVKRSAAGSGGFSALGAEGLIISNGLVRMTSLDVGGSDGNSFLTFYLGNGMVTNTGDMIVRQVSPNRSSRFLQTAGLYVCSGANGVNLRGHTNNNSIDIYSVLGGTNLVTGFVLGTATDTTGTIRLTNTAKIYIGSGGFASQGTLNTKTIVLNAGGTFGAQTDWSGTEPIILAGGSFDAGNLDGTPQNIALSGVLSGSGALIKNGAGTLTLSGTNTYSGQTLINQGTLALGPTGSILNSPTITIASSATFDVSAVSGFTLGTARTLSGSGTVVGNVAVAGGGIVNPGTSPGTLTLANSLTETGGAVNHFDLPAAPGPGNDLLVVNGDLNVSGVNTLEIVGGGSPGTVHTLIQYGGNFNGTLAGFSLSGASGILSNDVPTKTIALIVLQSVRSPTNVVWVGNPTANDWDTVNRTNWLNTGTGLIDYFVAGDNALFSDLGAANPNVNLVGNNAAATVTVGATAHYVFGGSGAISGSGGLTKTNTGTLTITNLNTYSGVTTIGGGVLEAATLANGGAPSSIGSAQAGSANLVLDGGALRYTGASVTTDRGATLNANGGTIDVATDATALTIAGPLTGTGALTKSGPGILALGTANSYTNGTVISAGTLQVNIAGAAGTGPVTNQGATLRVNGAIVVDNAHEIEGACNLELSNVGSGNVALRGAWSGSGTVLANFLTQNTSQTLSLGGEGSGGGTMWNFTGTLNLGANRGFCRLNNNSSINFGSSNAVFNLGTGDVVFCQRNGGTTTHLGALLGGPNTRLSGARNDVTGITTYSIGGLNSDTVFEGSITNGQQSSSIRPAAIIKVGTGKLTLTGESPYTGTTTVEAGTLQVDGAVTASPITVTGGTLAGSGAIGGTVDVQYGGTLSPGASIGQLTISNTLSLGTGSTNLMEINKATGANDSIVGLTAVTYGGTLVVTNLAGVLAPGDTFKLFDAVPGTYAGAFDYYLLPALPERWSWDTSGLVVDGTIKVVTPILRPALIGGELVITGTHGVPNGNYNVLTSTNAAAPLSQWTTNASYLFDATGAFSFTNAIDAGTPQRFFRLQIP